MKLNDYFSSEGALTVAQLREQIGALSDAQIRQWQHGYDGRKPSPANCVAIERATGGAVTRRDLRDDWHLIWPELLKDALNEAITAAGGLQAFAEKVRAPSVSAVKAWKLTRVPAEYCPDIERITNGKVRCEHLRPDVNWGVLREETQEA